MRSLLTLSLVLLVAGLALGLLNLYIDGRMGAPLVFGVVVAVAAVMAFAVNILTRK
jgi:hypothetical protein